MRLKNVTFSVFYLFFSVDKWLKNVIIRLKNVIFRRFESRFELKNVIIRLKNVIIRLKNVIFKNQKASKYRGFQTYPQLKNGSLYYYYIIYIINNI